MEQMQKQIRSKIGPLFLVASERGLKGIFWKKQALTDLGEPSGKAGEILNLAETQLEEYFNGERREFDLPLEAEGSLFQNLVWEQLKQIPYGETRSYKEIAKAVGGEKACRAVGTANGRNPLSIVVPCHRVINAGGALGGYAGGLEIKSKLLSLEKNGRLP